MLIFSHLSQLCPVWVADHADANEIYYCIAGVRINLLSLNDDFVSRTENQN